MGTSFFQGFEVSSSSDNEEEVNTGLIVVARKSSGDSSLDFEELGCIRVVKGGSKNPE